MAVGQGGEGAPPASSRPAGGGRLGSGAGRRRVRVCRGVCWRRFRRGCRCRCRWGCAGRVVGALPVRWCDSASRGRVGFCRVGGGIIAERRGFLLLSPGWVALTPGPSPWGRGERLAGEGFTRRLGFPCRGGKGFIALSPWTGEGWGGGTWRGKRLAGRSYPQPGGLW